MTPADIACVLKNGGIIETTVKHITGRHSIFFKITTGYDRGWAGENLRARYLFELAEFVFTK